MTACKARKKETAQNLKGRAGIPAEMESRRVRSTLTTHSESIPFVALP